ncbi:hypothetical protein [Aureispira sp. CCB-E]|uniref:hypothetical protein n=1 Tax=Aureispira sp. CCB-E TaxID=3051121 RepID=UPI002869634F|nr:hypothetical protein [Aureispira sp. CCB-E]WMX16921.1 hypothetical protein QP953_11120 [Aureispira sp. CCB-E]
MEDNNNNLGDFFRKRLSSIEGEDADWFHPDPRTDDVVLQNLIGASKNRKKTYWLKYLLPALLILAMLAYIFYLKHHIAQLEYAQATSNTQTINTTPSLKPLTTSINTHQNITLDQTTSSTTDKTEWTTTSIDSNTIKQTELDKEITKKANIIEALKAEKQHLQTLLAQQNKTIQTLEYQLDQNNYVANVINREEGRNEKPILSTSNGDQKASSILSNAKKARLNSDDLQPKTQQKKAVVKAVTAEGNKSMDDLQVIAPSLLAIPSTIPKATPDYSFSLKKKKKRELHSLEVGFQVGLQALFTEKEIDILNQRIIADKELTSERLIEPYVGANIAYSPFKNIWVRAGIQLGGSKDFWGQRMGIVYSDAQEYLLPSGDVGSDLIVNTSTGYTKAINTLQLTVPSTTTDGDLVELDYWEELETTHIQIPLSVEYHFDSKRWQPFIYAGAKWNVFRYEYKTSNINVMSNDQAINFALNEDNANTKTLQYMSFMTGAGLSWNVRPHFSLRTTLGVENNFMLKENKSTDSSYSKSGLFANFGVYYKL